jgi:hypothetical protein
MIISFNVQQPAGAKVAQNMNWIKATAALDDLHNKVENLEQYNQYSPMPFSFKAPLKGEFTLSFPAAAADRLVVLRGVYPVLIEDEVHTVELDFPPEKGALKAPLVKNPLTITELAYSGDFLTVKYLLGRSVQCATPPCSLMSETKAFDSKGIELKQAGGGENMTQDQLNPFEMYYKINLDGKTPAKLTVRYCNKVHLLEIPFEFKDIGLPRKLGKWDVENSQF